MIRILVDSSSDCRPEDGLDLQIVPIAISLDEKQYYDGVDLDRDSFYQLLTNTSDFPKTSQPSPQDFTDIFEEAKAAGDELIYIALSSALSGTYQSACIARNIADYDKIYIVDTLSATHLVRVMAEYALSLRDKGLTAEEIVSELEVFKKRVKVFAVVDTLEYLYRGGRLSRASAAIGTITNVKPILTVMPDGTVGSIGKCIGKAKAMQFLLKQLESAQPDPDFPIYSLYSYGTENCEALEETLRDAGYPAAKRLQIGPTIGTHTGPGVCGVILVTK